MNKRYYIFAALFSSVFAATMWLWVHRDHTKDNTLVRLAYYKAQRLVDFLAITSSVKTYKQPKFDPSTENTYVNSYFTPDKEALNKGGIRENELLLVADDLGGSVRAIKSDGTQLWKYEARGKPRSLKFSGDSILFIDLDRIVFLNWMTGNPSRDPIYPGLGMLGCTSRVIDDSLYLCLFKEGKNAIANFMISRNEVYFLPNLATSYARSIEKRDDEIIIADTFGHQYIGYSLKDEAVNWRFHDYFPNAISVTKDGGLLFLSEHSNRLLHSTSTSTSTLNSVKNVFGFKTRFDQREIYRADFGSYNELVSSGSPDHPSKADRAIAGSNTLYSPNDLFVQPESGDIFIADTDNSRIVRLTKNFEFVGEVLHVYNPASVLIAKLNLSP